MTQWPNRKDYNRALNCPSEMFTSEELKTASIQRGEGFVNFFSVGRFACIAKARIGKKNWALRFFLSEQAEIERRYVALQRRRLGLDRYFVDFAFLDGEVRLEGFQPLPMIKMEWVEGDTLGQFVSSQARAGNSDGIRWVRNELSSLRASLLGADLSHGDLSADNVLIRSKGGRNELVLVDYDGIWMEELDGVPTSIGNGPLQHPQRPNPGGKLADVMAFEIIDLVLGFLERDPHMASNPGVFDKGFVLSVDDLIKTESEAAKKIRSALPKEFERVRSYARGPYTRAPSHGHGGDTQIKPTLPASRPSSAPVMQMTVSEISRLLGVARRDVQRQCFQWWRGTWSSDRVLTVEQVGAIWWHFKNEASTTGSQLWMGSVSDLARDHGLGTAQVREILRRLKVEAGNGGVSVPRANSMQFPLSDDVVRDLRDAARDARVVRTTQASSTTWTVKDLAAKLGVVGSDVRALLREIGVDPPPLDDMDLTLDDTQLDQLKRTLVTRETAKESGNKSRVPKKGTAGASSQLWMGSVSDLARDHGLGTAQVREILRRLKVEAGNGGITVPRANSMQFTLSDDVVRDLRDAARDARVVRTTQASSTTWTVKDLAAKLGVPGSDVRASLRNVGVKPPYLDHDAFTLDDEGFNQLVSVVRALGGRTGTPANLNQLAAMVNKWTSLAAIARELKVSSVELRMALDRSNSPEWSRVSQYETFRLGPKLLRQVRHVSRTISNSTIPRVMPPPTFPRVGDLSSAPTTTVGGGTSGNANEVNLPILHEPSNPVVSTSTTAKDGATGIKTGIWIVATIFLVGWLCSRLFG